MTYKPMNDNEAASLQFALDTYHNIPPSYWWPHVLEQCRRANRLAEAVANYQRIDRREGAYIELGEALRSYRGGEP